MRTAIMTAMPEVLTDTPSNHLSGDTATAQMLQEENQQLREQVSQLEHQLNLLQRMIFGTKSERHVPENPHQLVE